MTAGRCGCMACGWGSAGEPPGDRAKTGRRFRGALLSACGLGANRGAALCSPRVLSLTDQPVVLENQIVYIPVVFHLDILLRSCLPASICAGGGKIARKRAAGEKVFKKKRAPEGPSGALVRYLRLRPPPRLPSMLRLRSAILPSEEVKNCLSLSSKDWSPEGGSGCWREAKAARPAPQQSRPAFTPRQQPLPPSGDQSFEDKLKQFLTSSEGKMADLNRSIDGKRGGGRRRK